MATIGPLARTWLSERPTTVPDERHDVHADDLEVVADHRDPRPSLGAALLLRDNNEPAHPSKRNYEGIRLVAATELLNELRERAQNLGRGALRLVIEREKKLRMRLHPLAEAVVLPGDLTAYFVGRPDLVLVDHRCQPIPQAREDVDRVVARPALEQRARIEAVSQPLYRCRGAAPVLGFELRQFVDLDLQVLRNVGGVDFVAVICL